MLWRKCLIVGAALLFALGAFVFGAAQAAQKNRQQTAVAAEKNRPPTLSLESDTQVVTVCADDEQSNSRVRLRASAVSPDNLPLRYRWTVSGGQVTGEGSDVVWDLAGVAPGTYNASVDVESGPSGNPLCTAFSSTKVIVRSCPPPRPVCPSVSIYCPDTVTLGEPIAFTASVSGGTPGVTPVYNWTVSAGTILSGQGTPTITVDTANLGGRPITARVSVAGYNLDCTATCTTQVPAPREATLSDQYHDIARDDEKARLDNFAIAMQNEPGAQGYIIAYAGRRSRPGDVQKRLDNAKAYLTNVRGIDASRVVTLSGGFRESVTTELWIVPSGANPPRPR